MQLSDLPARFPIPFANNAGAGFIRSIPQGHQTASPTDAPASLYDGFPPETFTDPGAGGVPPSGRDMNGILNQATKQAQWDQAGAPATFNSTFATAIGGYPRGSILLSSSMPGLFWVSTADNNTTNPDAGGASNWAIAIDSIVAQSLALNGYRQFASGFKECWGRTTVGAGGTVTITMPITHTGFIIPTISAAITNLAGSNNQVGVDPPDLNTFVIRNWSDADKMVDWSTRGV
jgi:hypothetical protein